VVREHALVEMLDTYEVRVALECRAVRGALARSGRVALIGELRDVYRRMRQVAAEESMAEYVRLDQAFHGLLFDAAGNEQLARTARPIFNQIGAMTSVSNALYFDDLLEVAETHEPFIAAIETGDPAVAECAVVEHSARVWERALQDNPKLQAELDGVPLLDVRFADVLERGTLAGRPQ
jgi:DNA-binding GntR family transcriptional regulator